MLFHCSYCWLKIRVIVPHLRFSKPSSCAIFFGDRFVKIWAPFFLKESPLFVFFFHILTFSTHTANLLIVFKGWRNLFELPNFNMDCLENMQMSLYFETTHLITLNNSFWLPLEAPTLQWIIIHCQRISMKALVYNVDQSHLDQYYALWCPVSWRNMT